MQGILAGRTRLRVLLLAATAAAGFAGAARAQSSTGYPIQGFYIGLGGGLNMKGTESFKNISPSVVGHTGISTPDLKVGLNSGGAGLGAIGYGLGNGLRLELEGDYRSNSFGDISGWNPKGFGVSSRAQGSEQLYGGMVNAVYDFTGISVVVPYLGVGVGGMISKVNDFAVAGTGSAAALSPVFRGNGTEGAFAVQGIAGMAIPVTALPGLAVTLEYRIMALTGTRTYDASLTATLPKAGTTTGNGTFQLGHEYNNTFMLGFRYAFNAAPPPPPPAPPPAPVPAAVSRNYLVFFDWDRADLTDRARQIIAEAAANSKKVAVTHVQVNGYTDTSGTPAYNQGLSVRRGDAVAAELVKDGVPRSEIGIEGFGETHLLVPTGPGVREPQNRRVEIILQ